MKAKEIRGHHFACYVVHNYPQGYDPEQQRMIDGTKKWLLTAPPTSPIRLTSQRDEVCNFCVLNCDGPRFQPDKIIRRGDLTIQACHPENPEIVDLDEYCIEQMQQLLGFSGRKLTAGHFQRYYRSLNNQR